MDFKAIRKRFAEIVVAIQRWFSELDRYESYELVCTEVFQVVENGLHVRVKLLRSPSRDDSVFHIYISSVSGLTGSYFAASEIYKLRDFLLFHLDSRTAMQRGIWEQPTGMSLTMNLGARFCSVEFDGSAAEFCYYDGDTYQIVKLGAGTLADIRTAIRRNYLDMRRK